eukprot:COSAG04_NODE_17020_length_481_cov_3.151832_1_plen_56_part_10
MPLAPADPNARRDGAEPKRPPSAAELSCALAAELPKCQRLRTLYVYSCGLGEQAKA